MAGLGIGVKVGVGGSWWEDGGIGGSEAWAGVWRGGGRCMMGFWAW
jgi:hypothetical protein